ncbi:protein containg PAS domain S-box [Longilinea arvoryzae]|uniref:Protein containg PAS domain S-box n=1 Tax=Longilinea arvoryzae TaxID=360412 RepID=A0A0S7BMR9_9CHLR|nr:GAF domain-containing protein [Longilinea arvoryzae]GAP15592.1 protein containg PAS domain S-box [Longilinea arvoryzae]
MNPFPDRIVNIVSSWTKRPLFNACLSGLVVCLLLILLRSAANIWSWILGGLIVALAAWRGYRFAAGGRKFEVLRTDHSASDVEFAALQSRANSDHAIVERLNPLLCALNTDLFVTWWNPNGIDLLQDTGASMIGKPLAQVSLPGLAAELQRMCLEALGNQQVQRNTVECSVGGSLRRIRFSAHPSPDGVSVLADDATEQEDAFKTVQHSSDYFRTLFQEASNAIFVHDPIHGAILDVNAKMCEMWGYRREELLQMTTVDLVSTDSHFTIQALRRKVMKTLSEGPQVVEWLAKDTGGRPFWVEVVFKQIFIHGEPRLLGAVRDITDRKRTAGEINSLATKLRVIGRSASNLTAQLNMHALAEQVVDSLQEATSCYTANVFMAEDGKFRWEAGTGGDLENPRPAGLIIAPGQGLVGTSAQQGKPILSPDVFQDERYVAWEGFPETRSELVFPVKSGDRVLAVVDLQSAETAAFDSSDFEAVGVLVDQMAVALENIHLFEDTHRWTHEMEMLVQITTDLRSALTRSEVVPIILDSLVKLFQADGAMMTLKDMLSSDQVVELGRGAWIPLTGRRFSIEKGLMGQVVSEGKSVLNNDLAGTKIDDSPRLTAGLQALAWVALIAQEQVIGTLAIGRNLALSEDELHILETIADIVASAIQRANLFDQTERRLRQVQSLRTIDMAITADMSLRVTLHIILDQVMVQLHVDAAAILLFRPETQMLEYTAGLGFRSRAVPQRFFQLGEDIAGKVAQERRILKVLNFMAEDAPYPRSGFFAEEGIQSYFGLPMVAKGQLMGVLEIFHRSPLDPEYEWLQLMEALSVQAAIAINNTELFERLQQSNQELMQAYESTLEGWARALELRDRETEGHSRRVTEMTVRLARRMGFSDAQLVHVRRGALLHDIGKMGIPDSILFKPGLLDEREWEIMRLHPVHAYQLLAPIAYLQPALEIPYSHHERWDGTGYPLGLKGEQIPLAARIFAVVDVWDALISDRPYQQAWEEQKIRDYIHELANKQLDPHVVTAFFDMIDHEPAHGKAPLDLPEAAGRKEEE